VLFEDNTLVAPTTRKIGFAIWEIAMRISTETKVIKLQVEVVWRLLELQETGR
jgi:hypothetical protein